MNRCNNLAHIYGADIYAPAPCVTLKAENAGLRKRVKVLRVLALVGWLAVVLMGVFL